MATRRAFLHGTRGISTLYPDSLKGAYDILKLVIQTTLLSCLDILSKPNTSVLTKSLSRETQAILVYTARSTLDGIILSHFRQPVTAYTPPPAEQKDRDGSKSSLPPFLTVACRTMIALPPHQHHHDKSKSFPTIKGDRTSDIIKMPSYSERRQTFLLKK
uniref:Uncharacterized protein n=1 Tax=Vitis vinifera TaxID=29760 RepID=A5CBV2_VITVI|nr:hypothetical protein VITISV_040611 [Vitis vinifera]